MEDTLAAIAAWLPGSGFRTRQLIRDARDKISAACWSALRM